jgi:hypothetical protein
MSWQAVDAVRDHSETRGAARNVAFVMATYADKHGDGVYPSIATIAKQAKVTRKTAIDARRLLIESGEVEVTRWRETRTKSPSPEVSFAPLIAKGSPSEPLLSEPLDGEGFDDPTLKGSPGEPQGFAEDPPKGSPSEPEPPVEPSSKSPEEAAAAAAASPDGDLEQLVSRIYGMWKAEVFPDENKPLTDARRRVVVDRLAHYEPAELEEAIRNREASDWFSGRKPQDGKQRYDLTDLLASDMTLEELRDARPTQNGRRDFIARLNGRRGFRDPALVAIVDRDVDEDANQRRARMEREQGEVRPIHDLYAEEVEAAVVVPTPTPAQLRAEHAELVDDVEALQDQYATNESPATLKGLEQRRSEVAKLEAEHPHLFGGEEVAA